MSRLPQTQRTVSLSPWRELRDPVVNMRASCFLPAFFPSSFFAPSLISFSGSFLFNLKLWIHPFPPKHLLILVCMVFRGAGCVAWCRSSERTETFWRSHSFWGYLSSVCFCFFTFWYFPFFFIYISEFFKTKNILADIFCFLSKYIYVI